MYHEYNSYVLLDKKTLALSDREEQLKYEAFVLGDFIVSFGISLESGSLDGEMCLHGGGTPAYILDFKGSEVYTRYNPELVATLSDKRCDISILYSVARRRFDIYVDGKLAVENYCADSGIPINCDKLADFFITLKAQDTAEVTVYDLKAHSTACKVDGAVVYDPDNTYAKREIKIELTDKNYFPEEASDRALLEGALAVHMRSGLIYRDGKKVMATHMPYADGEKRMVAKSDLLSVLTPDECAALSTLATTSSGVEYLDLNEVAEALARRIYSDSTTVNHGMVVLTKDEFTPPSDNRDLQKLNDFLFYLRPDKDQLLQDYKASPLAGVHPRLVYSEDDFARLRREIKENKHKARWFSQLLEYCDRIKDEPTLRYELRDGVRLLFVSWDLQNYSVALALAYKLTGDRKYFDYAWPHLKACAEMPDWNPSHHIDVGTLAYGYAIAYDWFYDVMSEEQKRIMEKGAYENVFYTVNRAVEDPHTAYTTVLMGNNHNVFCNAGVMATVLGFMDVYPEIAAKVGADVIRILEAFMDKFAPMGAYYEGPYYAETAINYTVRVLAAMIPILGTTYGIEKAQGFDMIADFVVLLQSDVASYNFADSKMSLLAIAGMFWIFDHYHRRGIKDSVAEKNFKSPPNTTVAEALLWYNVADEGAACNVPTFVHYPEEEIIAMRDGFRDGQTFVGIKAGKTVYAHSHLDAGSFIFDAKGRRWAYDFGQDNYNLYYKYSHWDVFRLRAESHNTLVINPDSTPGYVLGSEAPVSEFTVTDRGIKTVIEKTALYGAERGVESARRGYLFTDSRSSLVVRDEVKLTRESDMIWLMYTDADIEISGNVATLYDPADRDKWIEVVFTAGADFTLGYEDARPLPTSPDIPEQRKNEGFHRLYLRMRASGDVTVTAKINTVKDSAPVSAYDVSIDEWKV